jgi:N-acetylneuraminic acid mutarotase
MRTARSYHSATLLQDGRVLVAGGYSGPLASVGLNTTEIYDPVTNSWTDAAPMLIAHASQAAARLADGRVLIAAGRSSAGDTTEAELYSPATNSWSRAGNLAVARTGATAIVLSTGKVLVMGGFGPAGVNPPAELYDPTTNSWSQLPNTTAHFVGLAVSLGNGKLLVLGDGSNWNDLFVAEYDPIANTWSPVDRPPVSLGGAVLLGSGKVLFFGNPMPGGDTRISELYDPVVHRWSAAAPMQPNGVFGHAVALPDGRALVAGAPGSLGSLGCGSLPQCPNAEVYDPTHDSWTATPEMAISPSEVATLTLLSTGKVIIAGGAVPPNPDSTDTAEIFDPTGS